MATKTCSISKKKQTCHKKDFEIAVVNMQISQAVGTTVRRITHVRKAVRYFWEATRLRNPRESKN